MDDDSRLVRASAMYKRSVFGGDAEALPAADRELGLLALAELADRDGRPDDARALLDEADAIAVASGADGIRRWIAETRAELEA
jgi:hypothetical protein